MLPYPQILTYVQQLAPTWRKPQHRNFAQLIAALLERENLALTDLARGCPQPNQAVHGRLKRIGRFLDNPHLDEITLFLHWFKLSFHLGATLPQPAEEAAIVPLLLDTVFFDPFALLVCTVPWGSRGLPVALTTYHREKLTACFPPHSQWPAPDADPNPPRPRRPLVVSPTALPRPSRRPRQPSRQQPISFLSQNQIEEELVHLIFSTLSSALRGVIVADRGFARASFFRFLHLHERSFVIRFDAQTHVALPQPFANGLPMAGPPAAVLGINPGQRIWCPGVLYGKEDRVPIHLLAVWDPEQREPWYLATDLTDPDQIERVYRWRMRLECANRDEKTGVILREGGDHHALRNVVHVHRLLLALSAAEWLCALVGLQAYRDLPAAQDAPLPLPRPIQTRDDLADLTILPNGPADPPPIVPHRGARSKTPIWLKRFVGRGPLSYVRLGREILKSPDLTLIVARLTRWLTTYLWPGVPLWHPPQIRYRIHAWWANTS